MKDRTLACLSLTFSVAALAYSAWVHQNADRATVEALRQRELAFVTACAPKMKEFYSAMNEHPTEAFPSPPQTIEELFKPVADIIAKFNGPELPLPPPPLLRVPREVPQ